MQCAAYASRESCRETRSRRKSERLPREIVPPNMSTTVDKSEARVRRMFGEIASRYDRLNHLLSLGIDLYWRRQTVKKVPPRGTDPILDLCTGTGDLALAYFQAGGRQTPVVGADFCHPMLVIGRGKADQAGAGEIAFVEADAQQLPFPDDHFQIVSVAFGLRNVTDTDRGLRRDGPRLPRRRAGRGARVLDAHLAAVSRGLRLVFPPRAAAHRPGVWRAIAHDAYHYLPASVGEFPCGEALAERIRAAGADDVRYFPLTFGVATLYVGTK